MDSLSNSKKRAEFANAVTSFADRTILLSNVQLGNAARFLDFSNTYNSDGSIFSEYQINPFGFALRDQIVEKWLSLDDRFDPEGTEYVNRVTQITGQLNFLTSHNWLPAFPVYIIAVLQNQDAISPIDTRISTYGAYYELFIRNALARGRTTAQFNGLMTYLSFLAFRLFQLGCEEIDSEMYRQLHREYEDAYQVRLEIGAVKEDLAKCGVLFQGSRCHSF